MIFTSLLWKAPRLLPLMVALSIWQNATAQNDELPWQMEVAPAATIPLAEFADRAGTGLGFTIGAKRFIDGNFAVGIESGQRFFLDPSRPYPEFSNADYSTTVRVFMSNLMLSADYYLLDESPLRPFLGLSLGAVYAYSETEFLLNDTTDTDGEPTGALTPTDRIVRFQMAPRIGADYAVNDRLGIVLTAAYQMTFTRDTGERRALVNYRFDTIADRLQTLDVRIGLRYRL